MADGLTPRQRDAVIFIQAFIDEHGFSPSFEEIRAALGYSSKGAAYRTVEMLVKRGWVDAGCNGARSLTLRKRWTCNEVGKTDLRRVAKRICALADSTLDAAQCQGADNG